MFALLKRALAGLRFQYLAVAIVVALAQLRLITLIFGRQYKLSVDVAAGVVNGLPHWRVFQNRLMGPYLVQGLSAWFGSFSEAYVFATALLLAACAYTALLCLEWVYGDPPKVFSSFFLLVALESFCFLRPWLYTWDFLDLLFFLLFNAFVVRGRGWKAFAALFLVAVWNRESASFIALWMILDPLTKRAIDHLQKRPLAPVDWPMVEMGAVLLVGGAVLVEHLRSTLLVREVGPQIVGPVPGAGPRFHYMVPDNIRDLRAVLTSLNAYVGFLVPLLIVGYAAFCVALGLRDPRKYLALAAVHFLLLGSTLIVALIFETRVFLGLLPFVAIHFWTVFAPSKEPLAQSVNLSTGA